MNTCEACKCNKVCNHDKFGFENCGNYISEDVVEVVRCKDCEHRETFGCPMYTEEIVEWDDDGYFEQEILVSDHSTDTGFCSCGKRKDDV